MSPGGIGGAATHPGPQLVRPGWGGPRRDPGLPHDEATAEAAAVASDPAEAGDRGAVRTVG